MTVCGGGIEGNGTLGYVQVFAPKDGTLSDLNHPAK